MWCTHFLVSKALRPGSEERTRVRADAVYPDTRGRGLCDGDNREDINLGARFGLIRDHQLAMPGLFRVMKYIWHELPPFADEKNTLSLRSQRNLSR